MVFELVLGTSMFFLDMNVEAVARSKGFCTLVAILQIVTRCRSFMSECCVAVMMIMLTEIFHLNNQLCGT